MADNKPSSSAAVGDGGEGSSFTDADGKSTVSLMDYIKEESELEEDARAVLGGSDTQNCTYSEGYVQRQALYACATCVTDDKDPAGICLACSLDCHDGHELFELYTKRFFRCDCGNSKFQTGCKLQKNKDPVNPQNKYNHNFRGLYCSCNRPYPDPDHEEDGEMIQCCLCEDWYHDNHLSLGETDIPTEYEEMICITCAKQNTFLLNYSPSQAIHAAKVKPTDEKADVDVTSSTDEIPSSSTSAAVDTQVTSESSADDTQVKSESSAADTEVKSEPSALETQVKSEWSADETQSAGTQEITPASSSGADSTSTDKADSKPCPNLLSHAEGECKALFMAAGWRQNLCDCSQCKLLYKSTNIEFLTDSNDPTHVYEHKAKQEDDPSTYERGMNALSSLGRVQQIELLSGYNDLKSSLSDYLQKFASNNKVVRSEDIQEFFEEYKKNKRRRLAVPPSSCS